MNLQHMLVTNTLQIQLRLPYNEITYIIRSDFTLSVIQGTIGETVHSFIKIFLNNVINLQTEPVTCN